MNVFLSPTLLGQAKKCPRCLYDQLSMKLKPPRGIMASLPNGIDDNLKAYTDKYRGKPIPGLELDPRWVVHPDQTLINELRLWNGLRHSIKIGAHTLTVSGGIDELFWDPKTLELLLVDFKTKSSEPPLGYAQQYYTETMDAYAWLLTQKGYSVHPQAFLWYFYPDMVLPEARFQFKTKMLWMDVIPARIEAILKNISELLPLSHKELMQKRPESNPACELCMFVGERMALE